MTQIDNLDSMILDEMRSVSLVFKRSKPFTLELAQELGANVEELIAFWLLAVPHFHDETRIASVKIRQPAMSMERGKKTTYALSLDFPGIKCLHKEREEKGVLTFLEFLVNMGEELRKGSKPRQDGTQKIAGTNAYDALFDQYEVFLRDGMQHPIKCIPGNKVSPKPKPPVGANIAPTDSAPVVNAPIPAVEEHTPSIDVTNESTGVDSVEYAKALLRIKALEDQVAKQKRVIDKLTDIIKTEV